MGEYVYTAQENNRSKTRSKKTVVAKKLDSAVFRSFEKVPANGEDVISSLLTDLSVSEVKLAALLETSDRSLRTWKKEHSDNLIQNKKSKRLIHLFQFIQLAKSYDIPSMFMQQLLNSPIDVRDRTGASIKDYINLPEPSMFNQFSALIIERFVANINSTVAQEIKLNKKDFDSLQKNLENPPEPNEALINAIRKRHK